MLSAFPANSVVVLARNVPVEGVVPRFRKLVDEHFPGGEAHFLVKRLSLALRLLMVVANRQQAPYDMLLRIDLEAAMTPEQSEALKGFRSELGAGEGDVLLFQTANFQFHNVDSAPADVAMAFINTWPSDISREQAQRYWFDHHGPLVRKIGLPPVITSYTQVHFDDSLDRTYQGLSFETITSQLDLVKVFVRDATVRRLNKALLADEKQFTGPPLFFAFEEIPLR